MPKRSDRSKQQQFEQRVVEVHEPQLSEPTNARLTDEVREVIGTDRVEVPTERPRPSAGEQVEHQRSLPLPVSLPDNFLVSQIAAALVVVGAIVALAVVVHRWWTLVLAVLVLGGMTYLVVAMIIKMTSNPERPSPSTVAVMEEEGVSDPEQLFSDVVAEFTEEPPAAGENRRSTAVEDDPAKAAAEQRDAITPSGGASRPVGPDS
jgi:hypothetical protein